ncbi:LacI family transcriptional regulator [Paenibacillus phyllosphaerae]|uniref:LacI family transcriptional regulator n=1 Tax=Paenibacillus phyllosphaerae TaxID=274593 RepID=A0A7W5B4N4_9BACL|nr:LacI family DNA-binding transcriptional regulator [Paenibacillus phyllosphaerae]MBB3114197.1 LacI family transcriptional regulator [Paenibacillus phyllosphaerae]
MNMEDIAKLAGVSKSAVSLALNGKAGVGEDTRMRILAIAAEHGYSGKIKPAAPEKNGRSIQFLVFTSSQLVHEDYYQQPFFKELIHYIEEGCRNYGYTLQFRTISAGDYEQGIQLVMDDDRCSGVILLGTNLDSAQIADIAAKLPHLVVLDTCFNELPVHFVEINNFMGGFQAGSYLLDQGHRRIGYIGSDERIHNFDERRRGFLASLASKDVHLSESCIFAVPPAILAAQAPLREQLHRFIDSGESTPTVFFCECDYIAIAAMKILHEFGYRVPDDVSVLGFDNINECLIVSPELSTVHVEKQRMAETAVDLIASAFEDEHAIKIKVKVDTRFVARNSCKRLD